MNKYRSKNEVHVKKYKEKNKENRGSVLQYVRIRCLLSLLLLTKGSLVLKHIVLRTAFACYIVVPRRPYIETTFSSIVSETMFCPGGRAFLQVLCFYFSR